jgi:hypothetical protein
MQALVGLLLWRSQSRRANLTQQATRALGERKSQKRFWRKKDFPQGRYEGNKYF